VRSGRRLDQNPYESVILNDAAFRAEYNARVLALTDPSTGSLSVTQLQAFLDQTQALLASALATDPYPTGGAANFSKLKSWLAARISSARSQAIANSNPAPRP
jgi:hypothetical protein